MRTVNKSQLLGFYRFGTVGDVQSTSRRLKDRLVEVTKDGVVTESYEYDSNGNRVSSTSTERNINATASYTLSDTIETFGNIGYVFDSDGYLKLKNSVEGDTTYSYARTGELLEVVKPDSTIISYTNDPMGRRVAKSINGEIVEKYLWLDRTTLLAVYDKDNNLISRFNYADSRVPYSMEMNSQTYYLTYDQVGSLRAVSDSSGNIVKEISYDSFGNIITDSNSNFKVPFGFAGGLQDTDTNLVRFGYRDYDPNIGKWTAKDPILFNGGDSNLYGYVLNDPINLIDVDGNLAIEAFYVLANSGVLGGGYDFYTNYLNMREANTIGADKYFHCLANCQASKRGDGGKFTAKFISETRELLDEYVKQDPASACNADREANKHGQNYNSNSSCQEHCNKFRPNGLDEKW